MKKVVKTSISIIALVLIISGVYWYIIHPHSYNYDTAVKNGDVVAGADGLKNVDQFHAFIKNVENKQPDKIRITAFSKEGYPEVFDINFDGNIIKCTTDNTRNLYGRDNTKRYGEYTKIIKNEINDYILVDETKRYESEGLFQE